MGGSALLGQEWPSGGAAGGGRLRAMDFFSADEDEVVVDGVSLFLIGLRMEAELSPSGAPTPGPPPAAAFPSLQSPLPFIPAPGVLGSAGAHGSPPPFTAPVNFSPDRLQGQV